MWILSIAFLVYAGCCAYLYFAQRSYIYFPVPASKNVAAEDLRMDMQGATVQVWRLHALQEDAVLYFGGNAEDVSQNIPLFGRLFPGKSVYLVNYRGYGASTGMPTEAALFSDAQSVFDRISESHSGISVVGRSLGSGVAVYLAATRKPERVALVTPFGSLARIAQSSFPVFPVAAMLQDRFESTSHAGGISALTLLLIAEQDEIIPAWSSQNLAAAIDSSVLTIEIVGDATHNTIQEFDRYADALGRFLQ
jgi:pimeloyl-ACP methyl ester carboxylesterase